MGTVIAPQDLARRQAGRIADALVESAIVVDGQATWIGPTLRVDGEAFVVEERTGEATLYDGSAGIALASWGVGLAMRRGDLLDTALSAARHAVASADRVQAPGLYDGRAGIGLAALRIGLAAGAAELIRPAVRILEELRGCVPDRSDVISGLAGIAIAMVRAAQLTGETAWLDAAASTAVRLVSAADRRPWGWAWPNGGDDPGLCGLAHGAAGVGWALAEVAAALDEEERFGEAIAGARQFERSWFDPRANRWPDLRPHPGSEVGGELPRPALWCHGSVGIGVSRIAMDACRPHPALKAEVAAALQSSCVEAVEQVREASIDQGLTVCHGAAGAVDFLIDAYLHLGEDVHLKTARWLTDEALQVLGEDVESWPGGVLGRPGPGLMNGMAGTMAVLTRLIHPTSIPSVVRLGVV